MSFGCCVGGLVILGIFGVFWGCFVLGVVCSGCRVLV